MARPDLPICFDSSKWKDDNRRNVPKSETLIASIGEASQLLILRMQKSPSPHAQFFTSLKRLEKRLKLENHPAATSTLPPPPPVVEHSAQQKDSLGTPIYLNDNQSPTVKTTASDLKESEAPQEFLSRSPDFPQSHHNSPHEAEALDRADQPEFDGDIELLMQLLRLSGPEELNERTGFNCEGSDDGFYGKIAGVKGPTSAKEAERLERWIKHFFNGEKKEPFRLAHLLLVKAAFMHSIDDCGDEGFGGLVFPSTIDEFLQNDPPID